MYSAWPEIEFLDRINLPLFSIFITIFKNFNVIFDFFFHEIIDVFEKFVCYVKWANLFQVQIFRPYSLQSFTIFVYNFSQFLRFSTFKNLFKKSWVSTVFVYQLGYKQASVSLSFRSSDKHFVWFSCFKELRIVWCHFKMKLLLSSHQSQTFQLTNTSAQWRIILNRFENCDWWCRKKSDT